MCGKATWFVLPRMDDLLGSPSVAHSELSTAPDSSSTVAIPSPPAQPVLDLGNEQTCSDLATLLERDVSPDDLQTFASWKFVSLANVYALSTLVQGQDAARLWRDKFGHSLFPNWVCLHIWCLKLTQAEPEQIRHAYTIQLDHSSSLRTF